MSYFAYWWVTSAKVKRSERRESFFSRLVRLVFMLSAISLLALPRVPLPILSTRFLPQSEWCFWGGGLITAAGLVFSAWARRQLGANWSQAVTIKEDHDLITRGPYALVRHPIYSGLLLALVGSAVARGEWRGLLAVVLVFLVLWHKLRLEEKWLRAHFGDSYDAYARRVAALVPHLF